MKKLGLIVVLLFPFLWSCSIEDENEQGFYLEVLPVDSVEMPDEFIYGETYNILLTYTRPTFCYEFNNFAYDINGHERTIAIVNTVYTNINCSEFSESITVNFEFSVTGTETYIFKFYQGKDENGQDKYYLVEVPVVL
ncbi:hypothetical protein [Winogradskyella alexanderae]|uniref:Uncharacterized protein n=1 Tax=Winogradskyella alexanderae TaxID=2877123 RepID=A0ABS7XQV6_9FLAO|nr:hypothetical protein [Winogradskyella alexanderae]MCA0131347.1 hypothetical protein [Winogradskyella alexanderae]